MALDILPPLREIRRRDDLIQAMLPMQALAPEVFDCFCADGWAYWSDRFFRTNRSKWHGVACGVVPLRINLEKWMPTRHQRRCLRQHAHLRVCRQVLRIKPEHACLFEKHARRFSQNVPMSLFGFFSSMSHAMPCTGIMLEVTDADNLVAVSYAHLGKEAMAGNYCVFDPASGAKSPGTYTMLLEIEWAKSTGRKYYYPGFVFDIASEFDYKLNFNGLEYFDWWGNWYPLDRLCVRNWREEYDTGR